MAPEEKKNSPISSLTVCKRSWIVSMQSTTIFGFPPIATTLSVDSGQHWEYTLICAPVLCGMIIFCPQSIFQ
jgi:hypothetical protein